MKVSFGIVGVTTIICIIHSSLPLTLSRFRKIHSAPRVVRGVRTHFPNRTVTICPSTDNRGADDGGTDRSSLSLLGGTKFAMIISSAGPNIGSHIGSIGTIFLGACNRQQLGIGVSRYPRLARYLRQRACASGNRPSGSPGGNRSRVGSTTNCFVTGHCPVEAHANKAHHVKKLT